MNIRKAELNDLDRAMELFDIGRNYMRSNGNENQWVNGYPQRELIENDIINGYLYACDYEGETEAVFAMIFGEDPTYNYIEGAWLNNEPYAAIHRVASSGKVRGIVKSITDFAAFQFTNLRGDTHADNITMQNAFEKAGYKKCGVIYLENGAPRIAYHKCIK